MGSNLGGETFSREQSLMSLFKSCMIEVTKGTLGPPEVPWGRVEDGVILRKAWSPTSRTGGKLVVRSFEYRTCEDGRGWCLLRCRGLRVRIYKAVGTNRSAGVRICIDRADLA